MKRITRLICLLLAVLMCANAPVFATGMVSPKASSFFWSSSVCLYRPSTSSTTFQAWFDVSCIGTMEEVGASIILIQRSSDGVNWTTMRTYTKEAYSNLVDHNTGTHASYVSYTGTTGYYYRACIVLYAKNSSGIGEVTEYTSAIKL